MRIKAGHVTCGVWAVLLLKRHTYITVSDGYFQAFRGEDYGRACDVWSLGCVVMRCHMHITVFDGYFQVLRGEDYGRACDVWSLGCVVIEMSYAHYCILMDIFRCYAVRITAGHVTYGAWAVSLLRCQPQNPHGMLRTSLTILP